MGLESEDGSGFALFFLEEDRSYGRKAVADLPVFGFGQEQSPGG